MPRTDSALDLNYSTRCICETPSIHTYFDVIPESPDGKHICFLKFDGKPLNQGTVVISKPDGSDEQVIAHCHATPHGAAQQGWLDNEHIYFSADGKVNIADLQGNIVKQFTGAIDTINQITRRGITPTVNLKKCGLPDDDEACYRVDIESGELVKIMTREQAWGLIKEHIDTKELVIEQVAFKHTKWSPNGEEWFVVFTTQIPLNKGKEHTWVKTILAADKDGNNQRFVGSFGHHPIWMPDGSAIFAFDRGSNKLLQWDPQGGPANVLTEMPVAGHPSMHPTLPFVVTDCHIEDQQNIIIKNIETNAHQIIYEGAYPRVEWQTEQHPRMHVGHAHPVWSADGKRLYLNHIEGEFPQLHAIDFEDF